MFKKRPSLETVRVIAITANKNLKAKNVSSFGHSYTEVLNPYTTVLYTMNGKLKTKDFDGVWTLEQVKNWIKQEV